MIAGKTSFYSTKLNRVIVCSDGYYKPKDDDERAEIKKYLGTDNAIETKTDSDSGSGDVGNFLDEFNNIKNR